MGAIRLQHVEGTGHASGVYPRARAIDRTARVFPGVTRAQVAAKLAEIQAREMARGNMAASMEALGRRIGVSETVVGRMLRAEVRIGLDELLALGAIGEEVIAWAMGGGR